MVAARHRERWYLYGDDDVLADDLLRRDLARAQSASERAWLLKHWPSLGGFDAAEQWLVQREPALLEHVPGRAAMLRVLQHHGDPNPWLALMPKTVERSFQDLCQVTTDGQSALELWLGGGLGDQLECLAQLHDPVLKAWMPRLLVRLPLQSRLALGPFLQEFWPKQAPSLTFLPAAAEDNDQPVWFSQMGWSCLLGQAGLQPKPQVLQPAVVDDSQVPSLLCCWRSKIDPDDRHWAHLRSWPFPEIARLYGRLVPWARCRGIRLIDITAYRSDERQTLLRHIPTLELAQPGIRSLCDTAALLRVSRGVISVDTALVHLAAWFGWPTLLLLHQYFDSRWNNRPLGLNQPHPIQVLRQTRYNSWREVSDTLLSSLADWPWL
ncbi:hypothetical protein [Synechococcus sp. A15-60]|uniref:hypothetical protein n=1 Tax=Synechococcus sp. A15-60 TaxID=1050655 RepID=UPI0016466B03|nr:hypothetical protein [Synechococcus sp. A15-60]QNI46821.1 hypothetical protein SynA1560_00123 [Synechococcus sp. A15-60]